MKRLYWIGGGVLILVVLIVLFVPGVGASVERRLLSWLAGAAG